MPEGLSMLKRFAYCLSLLRDSESDQLPSSFVPSVNATLQKNTLQEFWIPPSMLSGPWPVVSQHFSGVSVRSNVPVQLKMVSVETARSSSPAAVVMSLNVEPGAVSCCVALL